MSRVTTEKIVEDIPQVGDLVMITKGSSNFTASMHAYIGNIYKIHGFHSGGGAIFSDPSANETDLKAVNNWVWRFSDGHYRLFEKKKMKIKLNFK